MNPITTVAATTVVDALATDSWESTRAAVTEVWARTLPGHTARIDAELLSTRTEIRAARDRGDVAAEQRLVSSWQSRFAELVAAGVVLWPTPDPLKPVIGTWHKELGTVGAEVDFTSTVDLSITATGNWTFKVSTTGRSSDGSMSGMDFQCDGLVSPAGNGFEFRTSSEARSTWGAAQNAWSECADRFTSTVSDDGKTLRTNTDGQTMELTRTN